MRTSLVTLALAGTLGLTGSALLAPALASAQTPSPSTSSPSASSPSTSSPSTSSPPDRLTALRDALAGLVEDDTLTPAQADRVATTLDQRLPHGGRDGRGGQHGPGRHGGRVSPEATASVLGITVEELRAQREAGRTLAQVAQAEGVPRATLVDGLVAAAREQLAADVAAGELTQTQSDALSARLPERLSASVDRSGRVGRGDRERRGAPTSTRTPTQTPTRTPTPAATSTSGPTTGS